MRLKLSHLLLLAAFSLPVAAHADTSFILTTNGQVYTFSLGSPNDSSPNFYATFTVPVTGPGGTHTADIDFYNISNPQVFGAADFHDDNPFVYVAGPMLFTGPTSAPHFIDGFYNLTNIPPYNTGPATLQIGPTPEPSSLILLGTGILGLAGAARRRFKV